MAFADRELLRKDARFQVQVRVAVAAVAYDLLDPAAATPLPVATDEQKARARVLRLYAENVLKEPEAYIPLFCHVMAAKLTDTQVTTALSAAGLPDATVVAAVRIGYNALSNLETKWPDNLP